MAHTPFRVEVLTPEGSVFVDEVEMVSTRTEIGSIGILARHQPLLGMLVPTELRLYRSESDIVSYAAGEGYVQVSPDGVLVLVEEAHKPSELDAADLREKLRKSEELLSSAEEGTEESRRAARDKRRWEVFLQIAEGGASN
ncbi:MAG: F-type H+-transporting ATPase subunit epsilon [Solirubrobacteraceae bacterium]|jgi:F-type H+-transporting ATPase subunit epsilon|nr:F-type H+-transporting ATPase subunit epsilon [Solirubrobacteraceae bacterium]